jgi:hypothetical protein
VRRVGPPPCCPRSTLQKQYFFACECSRCCGGGARGGGADDDDAALSALRCTAPACVAAAAAATGGSGPRVQLLSVDERGRDVYRCSACGGVPAAETLARLAAAGEGAAEGARLRRLGKFAAARAALAAAVAAYEVRGAPPRGASCAGSRVRRVERRVCVTCASAVMRPGARGAHLCACGARWRAH